LPDNDHNKGHGAIRVLAVHKEGALFPPMLDTLRRDGFEVDSVGNVYAAVAGFAREPAEMAIVDLNPLSGSEMDCVRIFRELNEDVFILATFSLSHRDKAAEAIKLGADACLVQPFYPEELIGMLKRWAARARGRRDACEHYQADLEALARLAKGTAHEVNNPLTTLSGWLEMMELDPDRPGDERRRLASMREEAERIAQVVARLQEFGQQQMEDCEPVDVDDMLSGLLEEVVPKGNGIRVDCEFQAAGAVVWGDESLLRKACKILLEDALAGLAGNGTLGVRTQLGDGGTLELSVSDTGRCIPAEQLSHIFEPFASIPRSGEALSLAYPAAYGIIRGHGGELRVSSDEVNGTEFVARLPRVPTLP